MDPNQYALIRPFLTFAYNELLRRLEWERRFTISDVPGSVGRDPTNDLFDSFHHSIETPAVVLPPSGVTDLDVFEAFRRYTAQATVEYALVATTASTSSSEVTQLAVSRGEEHGVEIPRVGLQMISNRIANGDSFGTRFLHNHPPSFIHLLFQLAQLGPSSIDRSALMMEVARGLLSKNHPIPQFVLVEGGEFVEFKFPPWESVLVVLSAIWNLWHQNHPAR